MAPKALRKTQKAATPKKKNAVVFEEARPPTPFIDLRHLPDSEPQDEDLSDWEERAAS